MTVYTISEKVFDKLNNNLVDYQHVIDNEDEYGPINEGKWLEHLIGICCEILDGAVEGWIDMDSIGRLTK